MINAWKYKNIMTSNNQGNNKSPCKHFSLQGDFAVSAEFLTNNDFALVGQ
jgi:hypothetical protein